MIIILRNKKNCLSLLFMIGMTSLATVNNTFSYSIGFGIHYYEDTFYCSIRAIPENNEDLLITTPINTCIGFISGVIKKMTINHKINKLILKIHNEQSVRLKKLSNKIKYNLNKQPSQTTITKSNE